MNWVRLTFTVSLAALFVVTSFTTIFSAGNILGNILMSYILKVETCEYKPMPISGGEEQMQRGTERECFVDYNQAKREFAGGAAMMAVALPVAFLTYRKLRREIKEAKD